jgi:hypothetical protein
VQVHCQFYTISCCSDLGALSTLRHLTSILVPLHTTATLSHRLQGYVLTHCLLTSPHSSTTLNLTPMNQPHYNNSQDKASSSIFILLLSKLLQHKTDRCVLPGSLSNPHNLIMSYLAFPASPDLFPCFSAMSPHSSALVCTCTFSISA